MKPRPSFEYVHQTSLEETNALGNVYFAHHVRWQGRCREAFLARHAPEVLAMLGREIDLVTIRCSCEYLTELVGFDTVSIQLAMSDLSPNRVTLRFDYWVERGDRRELAARGDQVVACMKRREGRLVPCPFPEALREVLRRYDE